MGFALFPGARRVVRGVLGNSKNGAGTSLLIGLLAGCGSGAAPLPIAGLTLAGHPLRAEVAATPGALSAGLQGRAALPADQGMLFVLDGPEQACVWMKDTPVALSAAFLDADGQVLSLVDLVPGSTTERCASGAAYYVLEMPRGWFAARGVHAGARLLGADGAPLTTLGR